jgi:nitrilase
MTSGMTSDISGDTLRIAGAQIAPVWLNRDATLDKVVQYVHRAADEGARLVAFGEALVPGYPYWIEHTDGARFNDATQKALHALYVDQSVQIEAGHLDVVCDAARSRKIAVVLGCMERPPERSGKSIFASAIFIDASGTIVSVHRKLMPTHEERLSWSAGDGNGLRTHRVSPFTVGALNCWENWMPLARTALHAQGEDLHVGIWPGNLVNTKDITRFAAREGRSYVLSVSGVLRRDDIPTGNPMLDDLRERLPVEMANGGTCLAGPDGEWIVEPLVGAESLLVAEIEHRRVREERHNFDAAGHYGRPDVLQLLVDRTRQQTVRFHGE